MDALASGTVWEEMMRTSIPPSLSSLHGVNLLAFCLEFLVNVYYGNLLHPRIWIARGGRRRWEEKYCWKASQTGAMNYRWLTNYGMGLTFTPRLGVVMMKQYIFD